MRSRFGRWTAAALSVVALTACGPVWTQIGAGPGHAASNPDENTLVASSVGRLHTAWSSTTPTSSAVVDGSSVFAAQGSDQKPGTVVARDLSSGALRWSSALPGGDSALAADGTGGSLFTATYVANPNASVSTVVAAFAQSTGHELWSHSFPGGGGASLTFGDGRLFLTDAGTTRAFDSSGKQLWSAAFSGDGGSYAAGRYYTADNVRNAATGALLWRNDLQAAFEATTPVVSGTNVFVAGENGLDNGPRDGSIAIYPAAGCGHAVCEPTRVILTTRRQYGSPVISGDTVLAPTFYGFEAYSVSTGRLLWQAASDNDEITEVAAGDLAWTLDGSQTLRAYRLGGCGAATCPPVSVFSSPMLSVGGLLVTQGHLVYGSSSGLLVRAV